MLVRNKLLTAHLKYISTTTTYMTGLFGSLIRKIHLQLKKVKHTLYLQGGGRGLSLAIKHKLLVIILCILCICFRCSKITHNLILIILSHFWALWQLMRQQKMERKEHLFFIHLLYLVFTSHDQFTFWPFSCKDQGNSPQSFLCRQFLKGKLK